MNTIENPNKFEFTVNVLFKFSKLCTKILQLSCENKLNDNELRELNKCISFCKTNIQADVYCKDTILYITTIGAILDEFYANKQKNLQKIVLQQLQILKSVLNVVPSENGSFIGKSNEFSIYFNIDDELECVTAIARKDFPKVKIINLHNENNKIQLQKPCLIFTFYNIISRTEPEIIRKTSVELWEQTNGNSVIVLAIMKKDKTTAPNDVSNVNSGVNQKVSEIWTIYYKNDFIHTERPQMIIDENEFKAKLINAINLVK